MPSTTNSRYLQLADWILLEYDYSSTIIDTTVSTFNILKNKYTGTNQFVNNDISVNNTGNVMDRATALKSSSNPYWSYFDVDSVLPVINIDDNYSLTDVSSSYFNPFIKYDTVRIHILAGYNFEGINGLITQIKIKQVDGKFIDLASLCYLKEDTFIKLNENPIFLGEKLYDKFIEFKVPSMSFIMAEYLQNTANQNCMGNLLSDNVGIEKSNIIYIDVYEIDYTNRDNGNLFFNSGRKFSIGIESYDTHASLRAVLIHNEEDSLIEYFPTWDNNFIEEYILNLNAVGGDWAVIHQLEIYEQIGTDFIKTQNYAMIQETGFDSPQFLRPVIVNAHIAFSFSIDYTMRLFNRAKGEQIIRRASISSTNVKQYGKNPHKITLNGGFDVQKVYNKIEKTEGNLSNINFIKANPEIFTTSINTRYVPMYYSNLNVAINTQGSTNQLMSEGVYEQGRGIILINSFDNLIRLKVFERSTTDNIFQTKNLNTNTTYYLCFILDDNTKIYIEQDITGEVSQNDGELQFKIGSDNSSRLLNQTSNKQFYLITRAGADNIETVIYQGKFDNVTNRDTVYESLLNDNIAALELQLQNLQAQAPSSTTLESVQNVPLPGTINNIQSAYYSLGTANPATEMIAISQTRELISEYSNNNVGYSDFKIPANADSSINMSANLRKSIVPASVTIDNTTTNNESV